MYCFTVSVVLMSPGSCLTETSSSAELCFLGEGRKIPHGTHALAEGSEITLAYVWIFFLLFKDCTTQRDSSQKESKINEIIGMIAGFQMSLPMLPSLHC